MPHNSTICDEEILKLYSLRILCLYITWPPNVHKKNTYVHHTIGRQPKNDAHFLLVFLLHLHFHLIQRPKELLHDDFALY